MPVSLNIEGHVFAGSCSSAVLLVAADVMRCLSLNILRLGPCTTCKLGDGSEASVEGRSMFDSKARITPINRDDALKSEERSGFIDGVVEDSTKTPQEPLHQKGRFPLLVSPRDGIRGSGKPDQPVLIIERNQRKGLELLDLWAHRDLFLILAWRDIKVRYKQTILGAAWAVIQPLIGMIVFTVLFGKLARVPSEGEPYAIFSYAGLLPWNFFATAVTNGSNSLVASSSLITKVYFPRLLVPIAALGAALVDMGIASAILFIMMPFYGVAFHATLILFIPLVGLIALTAAAFAVWTSALNVKYRDIRYALPFAIQILMFLTPVIYPVSFLPERWRWVLRLNPLSGIIEGFRSVIFGHTINYAALTLSTFITFALLLIAIFVFRRMEDEFADIV
jgi:lipopolysaccharide transport system permease protein